MGTVILLGAMVGGLVGGLWFHVHVKNLRRRLERNAVRARQLQLSIPAIDAGGRDGMQTEAPWSPGDVDRLLQLHMDLEQVERTIRRAERIVGLIGCILVPWRRRHSTSIRGFVRPGQRLVPLLRVLLGAARYKAVIEPTLADAEVEWLDAEARGARWEARFVRLRTYSVLVRTALADRVLSMLGQLARVLRT